MERHFHLTLVTLAVVTAAAACENGRPWGADRQERTALVRTDFGPTAAYERRLLFLGPGQRLPSAAVLDFASLSDSVGVRRGIRARVADGTEWRTVLDAGWEMESMRDPWRLIPHGPLRLTVGDGGELDAVVLRTDPEFRLEPGQPIAEHSPDAGTQLVLRQGRLMVGEEVIHGILLDAQLGRTVDPAAAARDRLPGDGPDAGFDAGTDAGTDADREAATPVALAGTEALLLDNAGFYLVFATSGAGSIAWIHHTGRDDVRRGARLEPTDWARTDGGVEVPTAWRIAGPAELTGELSAETTEGVGLERIGQIEALGYAIVTGWVEDRGARREVFGLVRHVR